MRRYEIKIDIVSGASTSEEMLRSVLPYYVDASDEADAEAKIRAALDRWPAERMAPDLRGVTIYPSRVHVRGKAYCRGYDRSAETRILVRCHIGGIPVGAWMHLGDDQVPCRTIDGIACDWRVLGKTEGIWSHRPWDGESWEWVADAVSADVPGEHPPMVGIRRECDLGGRERWLVALLSQDSGFEISVISSHFSRHDAEEKAKRDSVQLGLRLVGNFGA